MPRRKRRLSGWLLVVLAVGAAAWIAMAQRLAPMPAGTQDVFLRHERRTGIEGPLAELARKRVVRDPFAMRIWLTLRGNTQVPAGTLRFRAGMDAREIERALSRPVRQNVRLREHYWARRNAAILEEKQVTPAEDYMEVVGQPEKFGMMVDFPLPTGSLEGYLYPDTYDLPPLYGAEKTVARQLENFQRKVWEPLGKPKDLHRAVIIGSMIELEVNRDDERPIVAGVIENRLRLGMPLQIDATINYGMQKWRPLTYADYRNVDSPYNTYRVRGLPPGPICSPTVKSIEAALNPAKHNYLYYVAIPGQGHAFAETYEEHLRNVARRRAMLRR